MLLALAVAARLLQQDDQNRALPLADFGGGVRQAEPLFVMRWSCIASTTTCQQGKAEPAEDGQNGRTNSSCAVHYALLAQACHATRVSWPT